MSSKVEHEREEQLEQAGHHHSDNRLAQGPQEVPTPRGKRKDEVAAPDPDRDPSNTVMGQTSNKAGKHSTVEKSTSMRPEDDGEQGKEVSGAFGGEDHVVGGEPGDFGNAGTKASPLYEGKKRSH